MRAVQSSAAAAASEQKVVSAVKEAVAKAKAAKPCGCTAGCNAGCGCRKKGFSCASGCGCKSINCLNEHTYTEDDVGRAQLSKAQDNRVKAKLKGVEEDLARRAEGGFA